jgi:hypothetical protein
MLYRSSISFYNYMTAMAVNYWRRLRPKPEQVDKLQAIKNMHDLAKEYVDYQGESPHTLHERLSSMGKHYVEHKDINLEEALMHELSLQYDRKGLLARDEESLRDFVYRANTQLFIHKAARETRRHPEVSVESETLKLSVNVRKADILPEEDVQEANRLIPYFMDLSWAAGTTVRNKWMYGARGLCFTLPTHNYLSFVNMRKEYKSREQYLMCLSHELTHMGTVYIDSSHEFTETKAYFVGSGRLGEFAVAVNATPPLLMSLARVVLEGMMKISLPDRLFSFIPKVTSAITIANQTRVFKSVRSKLHDEFGQYSDYILGRLTSEELYEMEFTNNIQARIQGKDSLRWRIMKQNLTSLMEDSDASNATVQAHT